MIANNSPQDGEKFPTDSREPSKGIQAIPIGLIAPGQNDRTVFTGIEELAESIRVNTLAVPILVRPCIETLAGYKPRHYFEIVAGERRYKAHLLNGTETIDAIVRELTDTEVEALMLAENTGRADLLPLEEARAYRRRLDSGRWTTETLAAMAGVSRETVRKRVNLLRLPADVLKWVELGLPNGIPLWVAEEMDGLDETRIRRAMSLYFKSGKGLSGSYWRNYCDRLKAEQAQGGLFVDDEYELVLVGETDRRLSKKVLSGIKAALRYAEKCKLTPEDAENIRRASQWMQGKA